MIDLLYRIPRVRGALVRAESAALAQVCRGHFGPGLKVFGLPIISVAEGSVLRVGRNAMLVSSSLFSEPGVSHPCVLRTLAPGASLTVGDDVGMSGASIVAAQAITIGDQVLIGADVIITDTDMHPVAPEARRWRKDAIGAAPVVIGDNVFLGARAIVLKGVTIGQDAVVGAGSVVTADVEPGAIVAGAPARAVGSVREQAR